MGESGPAPGAAAGRETGRPCIRPPPMGWSTRRWARARSALVVAAVAGGCGRGDRPSRQAAGHKSGARPRCQPSICLPICITTTRPPPPRPAPADQAATTARPLERAARPCDFRRPGVPFHGASRERGDGGRRVHCVGRHRRRVDDSNVSGGGRRCGPCRPGDPAHLYQWRGGRAAAGAVGGGAVRLLSWVQAPQQRQVQLPQPIWQARPVWLPLHRLLCAAAATTATAAATAAAASSAGGARAAGARGAGARAAGARGAGAASAGAGSSPAARQRAQ